jgi:hypothetical protein
MSVDYRLLPHFEASRERLEAARRALPAHWRNDPRPEAQIINEHWVQVIARAGEQAEQLRTHTGPGS